MWIGYTCRKRRASLAAPKRKSVSSCVETFRVVCSKIHTHTISSSAHVWARVTQLLLNRKVQKLFSSYRILHFLIFIYAIFAATPSLGCISRLQFYSTMTSACFFYAISHQCIFEWIERRKMFGLLLFVTAWKTSPCANKCYHRCTWGKKSVFMIKGTINSSFWHIFCFPFCPIKRWCGAVILYDWSIAWNLPPSLSAKLKHMELFFGLFDCEFYTQKKYVLINCVVEISICPSIMETLPSSISAQNV